MKPPPVDQLLRLLAEVAREHAILLLDADGHITWWNPTASRIFGISCEEVAGKHLSFLFTEEDRALQLPDLELEVARMNGAAENDRWLARPDGTQFWAVGATTCLRDDAGNSIGFGKILRNRTDAKEQIDTLRNTVDKLREQDEHRTTFLSTLSHEMRNPLTPLTNAAEVLRRLPADSVQRTAFLDIIDRQVAMLARLVDDLMDVARIGAGKVELELKVVVLQDVLRQAIESLSPRIQVLGHNLELLVPPVPILVHGDEQRLLQVFTNLVGNAIKYTPRGGNIWVKATVEENEAVARIEDDGSGIAPDMLPMIFDLFTQAERTRGQSQGGLGIGLSVVKDLVTLHGGSVQVRSDGIGKGSEFSVRLPLEGSSDTA